ncbi:MAG: hypothetical protein AAB613_02395 [Patescibacteria group bacterium]
MKTHTFSAFQDAVLMNLTAGLSLFFLGKRAVVTCYDDSPFGEITVRLDLQSGEIELTLPEDLDDELEIGINEETVPSFILEIIGEACSNFRSLHSYQG